MAGWLLAGFYCSIDLLFSDFARISRIFIWQAAADQSAAAGSIMKFPGNRIAVPGLRWLALTSKQGQVAALEARRPRRPFIPS
jgi:hypothetical protein